MVWRIAGVNTWAASTVVARMRAARHRGAYATRRPQGDSFAVESDNEPGLFSDIHPVARMYSLATAFDAPEGSWFLTATAPQLPATESFAQDKRTHDRCHTLLFPCFRSTVEGSMVTQDARPHYPPVVTACP
jgi:hypothetical protein